MTRGLAALVLFVALGLTGCGGGPVKADCDTDARYLSVVDGKRVIAPEGVEATSFIDWWIFSINPLKPSES